MTKDDVLQVLLMQDAQYAPIVWKFVRQIPGLSEMAQANKDLSSLVAVASRPKYQLFVPLDHWLRHLAESVADRTCKQLMEVHLRRVLLDLLRVDLFLRSFDAAHIRRRGLIGVMDS